MLFFLPKELRRILKRHRSLVWLINIVGLMLLLVVTHAVAFKFLESSSWETSIWVTWATFSTVGYGDVSAATTWGRICTMLFGTLGIMFLGAFFAAFFDFNQYLNDMRRLGFMSTKKGTEYVIFGYPGEHNLAVLLREVFCVEGDVKVCLVADTIEELPARIVAEFDGKIHFVRGSGLEREAYDKSRVAQCETVLVFPSNTAGDSDGSTRTVVDLLLGVISPAARLLYVLSNQRNIWMFESCNQRGAIPILENFELLAMVQEIQDPGTAVLIQRMLSNLEGANPKSVFPNKTVGWTWKQLVIAMAEADLPANLIGLIHGGEAHSAPLGNTVIAVGDKIIVSAENGFDWEKAETTIANHR